MKVKSDLVLPPNKKFGLTFSAVFFLLGAYLYTRQFTVLCAVSVSIASVFFLAALFFPKILLLPNKLWFHFGMLLHRITNPLVLGVIFFMIITPIALTFRFIGRDYLLLKKSNSSSTFWVQAQSERKISFRDQF